MRRGTTPTNTFLVDVNLTGSTVYVSYEQDGKVVLEKTGSDLTITSNQVKVTLSQQDTLKFTTGKVFIQLRYVSPTGKADASNIILTNVERIIKDGVIG